MTFPAAFPLAVQVQGSGYPILCLHGHPGSAASMSVFTEHLSQRFQTIAPDLRGYGRSQTNEPFTMQDHLIDLEALLDRLEIERTLILGWSLGGILAMELALKLPDRVSGLILVATAARPVGNHPPIDWQDNLYTGIASLINRVRPSWEWNIELFGRRSLYRYLLQQHNAHAYERLAHEGMSAFLQTSAMANQALQQAIATRYNRLASLAQVECPCLMLAGECDRHITAAASQETANHLPQCDWQCYPDTAHLFPWEIPDRVRQDVDRWLANHPAAIDFTAQATS